MARLPTCLLFFALTFWVSLCLANAYVMDNRQQYRTDKRANFAGMDIMCRLHIRNCPGGVRGAAAVQFGKRVGYGGQGEAPSVAAAVPRAAMVFPPISQLVSSLRQQQEAADPTMMMMRDDDNNDVDEEEEAHRRIRHRLVVPIRAAILDLLRRQRDVFPSGR